MARLSPALGSPFLKQVLLLQTKAFIKEIKLTDCPGRIDRLLWLIRPEPKFRAFAPVISRFEAACAEMQKPETDAPKIGYPLLFENMGELHDAVSGVPEGSSNIGLLL